VIPLKGKGPAGKPKAKGVTVATGTDDGTGAFEEF
jgi:hypothetical protein